MQLVVLEMPGKLPDVPQPTTFDLQPNPARTTFSIGRQADNDIILADSSVSRHHVEVQVFLDGIAIRDLGSANGTWLNNEQLAPQVQTLVRPGDRLRIGNVLTSLRAGTNQDLPTTALDSNAAPPDYNTLSGNYAAPMVNPPAYGQPNPPNYNAPPARPAYNSISTPAQQATYNAGPVNNPERAYQPPPTGGYGNYNPNDYTPGYVPVQPVPRPPAQSNNYMPASYPPQYQQPQAAYMPASDTNMAQAAPRRRPSPLLWLLPLLLVVIIVLAGGGFLLIQALNKNTSSYTTFQQLNFPSAPASANTVNGVLGVSVPTFNTWKRAQDSAGSRVVFSKGGQPTTALTIEKPPSATIINPGLSPDAAIHQYLANVQANAQNVTVTTPPIQVKLKDGTVASLAVVEFSLPNTVTDYRMHALAVQCGGNLYFVPAAG